MGSLFFEHALLADGWANSVRLSLQDGMIARIEPDNVPRPGDDRGGIAVPGMVNLHSHAFQRGMAGLTERRAAAHDSFWSWREVMYRFLDRLTPDDVCAIAALAYVEMLEGGFTRVGEFHYLHHAPDGGRYEDPAEMVAQIVAAAGLAGIRLSLLPCFYAHGGFGGVAPTYGQRRFINGLDGFERIVARCEDYARDTKAMTIGIAPHSLRAVSPDELGQLVRLAGPRPIHLHVAEQVREVENCRAWSGLRPVRWLLRHAPLDRNWCLVHATHMDASEARDLARTGAIVGLCPLTESALGDGIFPAAAWKDCGGGFGVGTDSNIQIDAAAELRQLEYTQRLLTRSRNVLAGAVGDSTAMSLFRAALAGGAAALAAPEPTLAVGAAADIVALDPAATRFAGCDDASRLDCWVFGSGEAAIRHVWVGGDHLVADGVHRHADAVRARYRRTVRALAAG